MEETVNIILDYFVTLLPALIATIVSVIIPVITKKVVSKILGDTKNDLHDLKKDYKELNAQLKVALDANVEMTKTIETYKKEIQALKTKIGDMQNVEKKPVHKKPKN